jgi:hypothetical protein
MQFVLPNARQFLRTLWKKGSRKGLRLLMFFSSEEKKLHAERWLRGREQCQKLRAADIVVVSIGKSGRTWLRVMLSRVYQQIYKLPEHQIIGFDNFHAMNREIPRIFFTHDNYIKNYTGNTDSKADFYGKKVILLARDPRDVAVSQFFQWKYRMKSSKKLINRFPGEGEDIAMFDFVMNRNMGIPMVIAFLNLWAQEAPRLKDFQMVRYEDLRADPEKALQTALDFMDAAASAAQVKEAVEYSSLENMKKMEQTKTFWLSGGKMAPKDKANPHSYKVRRGKVGGFRDYFEDDQVEQIETLMASTLSPYFGYKRASEKAPDTAQASGTSG